MLFRIVLAGLVFFVWVGRGSANDAGLVRAGDVWKYFYGSREPSFPAEAWRGLKFDDSNWVEGRSGFSLGYGGYLREASLLANPRNDYVSVYFRRKFAVKNPGEIRWLTLRIDYNDGFAAYLNGEEVARRGLAGEPGSAVAFNALRSTAPQNRWITEEINLTGFIPLLRPGENILAIQVHRASWEDPTLAWQAELVANFTRGPFIQNASTGSVEVIWKTALPASSTVEYGATPELGNIARSGKATTNHVMTLSGLEPGSEYYYRVTGSDGEGSVTSGVESFRTLKEEGPVRFVVLGDSGLGSMAQYKLAAVMKGLEPDLVMHLGDAVYPSFLDELADFRLFSVYQSQMKSVPYYFAIGNHDLYAGERAYLDTFYLPTNSVTGTEHFYSFDHGAVHFVVCYIPYLNQYTPEVGDNQYKWLETDLAESDKPWKFLFFHNPMQSSGPHRFDDKNRNGLKTGWRS